MISQNLSWTLTVEQDSRTGDFVITLPDELIDMQGWIEGDCLEWIENSNGSWTLRKVEQ